MAWFLRRKKPVRNLSLSAYVDSRNQEKVIFTPGPAQLVVENLLGLDTAFGRGDEEYDRAEEEVLSWLSTLSGQDTVVRLQGSASAGLEIMIRNFLYGIVVVVDTGFYSDRLQSIAKVSERQESVIREIISIPWDSLTSFSGKADWVVAAPVETSNGLGIPINELRKFSEKIGAKLMLDATASIGLEPNHELADAVAFSSCKGLFGLTGAAFVAYSGLQQNQVDSFYLNIVNHQSRNMTGPYHAILSLREVAKSHASLKQSVSNNKERCLAKFADHIVYPLRSQPLLCTGISGTLGSSDQRVILYRPRGAAPHSVLCHLGEAQLGVEARGDILNLLSFHPDRSRALVK